jgi:isoleucyl-tRNA synthetase
MFIAPHAFILDEPIYGRQNVSLLKELGSSFAFGSINISPLGGSGKMCCWNYSIHVGESEKYPTVCERCVAALEEIEAS